MRNTNENLAQFEVVNDAQKKVTVQLNPRIDLQIMAPLMQKLRSLLKPPLRNYTLDSLPPAFQDMKDYVIDEKESLTDISMKWVGNSDITVTVPESQSDESDFSSFSSDELLQLIGDASVMRKVLHQLALHPHKNPS